MTGISDIAAYSIDLAVFADLGTDPPIVEPTSRGDVIRLVRLGQAAEILRDKATGTFVETFAGNEIRHSSFKALLASDRYGSLREWATKQTAFLNSEMERSGDLIEVSGISDNNVAKKNLSDIDNWLVAPQKPDSTRVLLIDGPAGIGKTQFILGIADRRAKQYAAERRPLVLHVQSRGRTLSYIFDLIAFSLQRLRLDVTYDQAPVLAKYGLITIAIDGFDELADPDGYDLAWSQVNELIASLRGSGSIILAGRETFIGRDRVMKDIQALRADVDEVSVLTLQPPNKSEALKWLGRQGWTESQLDGIESFLEPSSIALRPFFLKTLSDRSVAERIATTTSTSILSILMTAMIEREATKFGNAVDTELSREQRIAYVKNLMEEVARDIAENSSVAVSEATLAWLVDVALPKELTESTNRILKARSQAVAFLTNDERVGYRRFYHEKFYEFFLANVLIETLSKQQVAKPLARNILGTSFLETFATVISGGVSISLAKAFLEHAVVLLATYPPIDRTRKNISSLLLASLSVVDLVSSIKISDVEMDEARLTETSGSAVFENVVISQLDCRGADVSALKFKDCTILTLIADGLTLLPDDFPSPSRIQDISLTGGLSDPGQIQNWITQHLRNPPEKESGLIPEALRGHPAIKLLERASRQRHYWLRRGDDVHAAKILDDSNWPMLERLLMSNNLLRVEDRQASGTDARFMHIRQSQGILSENSEDPDVNNFFKDLVAEISA